MSSINSRVPPLRLMAVDTPTDGQLPSYQSSSGKFEWVASGGGFTSFTVAGDAGASQTITDGNTLTLQGSGGVTKVTMSATDTATISLENTAVTAGSYTYASITVDAQGRLTAASSGTAPPSGANPTATISGTATNGTATTFMRSDAAPALANTTVTPGSYTNADITVDAQGRLTAASNGSGTSPGGSDGDFQINNSGSFGGSILSTNKTTTITLNSGASGDPQISMTSNTKSVTLLCDTNQKLKVDGGVNSFVFDASSATGGITWPDGTTQTTASTATIGGSIANTQVAYGSGTDTITGSSNLTFDGTNLDVGGYVKSGTGVYDTNGATDLTLQTNSGTNSGIIKIYDGVGQDIEITPNGAGSINLDGLKWPNADGTANQVLATDGAGTLSFTDASGGASTDPIYIPYCFTDADSGFNQHRRALTYWDSLGNSNTLNEQINFCPFRASRTETVASLGIYISTVYGSDPDDAVIGVYTSKNSSIDNNVIPYQLQFSATFNMGAGTGHRTSSITTATGGSATLTKGELYFVAYAPTNNGTDTNSQVQISYPPISGVSPGNARRNYVSYTGWTYGDTLALDAETAYESGLTGAGESYWAVNYSV